MHQKTKVTFSATIHVFRFTMAILAVAGVLLGPTGCSEGPASPDPPPAVTADQLGQVRQAATDNTFVFKGINYFRPTTWYTESEVMTITHPAVPDIRGGDCITEILVHLGSRFGHCTTQGEAAGDVVAVWNANTELWEAICDLSPANNPDPTDYYNESWVINADITSRSLLGCPGGTVRVELPKTKINTYDSIRISSSASIKFHGGSSIFPTGCDTANKIGCYYSDKTGAPDTMQVRWYPELEGNELIVPKNMPPSNLTATFNFTAFGGQIVNASWSDPYFVGTFQPAAGVDPLLANSPVTLGTVFRGVPSTSKTTLWHVDNEKITVALDPGDGYPRNFAMSGNNGGGGAYRIGDTITLTWDDTAAGDGNLDEYVSGTLDLSALGGPAAKALTAGNPPNNWIVSYPDSGGLLAGDLDGTFPLGVLIKDHGNHCLAPDCQSALALRPIKVDTRRPVVTTPNITISGATGTGGIFKAGDTLTMEWKGGDGGDGNLDIPTAADYVRAYASLSTPLAIHSTYVQLPHVAGSATVRRGGFVPDRAVEGSQVAIPLIVFDDAVNANDQTLATRFSPPFAIDTIVPSGTAAQISFLNPPAVYKAGSTVTVQWQSDTQVNTDLVEVGVDFSAIGAGQVVASEVVAGTYQAEAVIPEGGTAASTFTVTVLPRDDAGNVGSIVSGTMPVDARPPLVLTSKITVVNDTRAGQPLRVGDKVKITWDPADSTDVTAANVTCSDLGISQAAMTKVSGIWTYISPTGLVANGFDGSVDRVLIGAVDAAGNTGQGGWPNPSFKVGDGPYWRTTGLQVYSCLEVCALRFGGVSGDWACSTKLDSVDHHAFVSGYADSTYCSGVGVAEDFKKPAAGGPYNCGSAGCAYSAWVSDVCGNSTNTCWVNSFTPLLADLAPPVISPGAILVSGATGNNGSFKIGDTVTVRWDAVGEGNLDLVPPAGTDAVVVSYQPLGGPLVAAAKDANGIWVATWTVTPGTVDPLGTVTLTATDDVANVTVATSASFAFDNQLPQIAPNHPLTLTGSAGTPVKVGHKVTLTWTLGTLIGGVVVPFAGNGDISTLQGDFGAFGGGSLQAGPPGSDKLSLVLDPVPAGDDDNAAATVPVVIRDDAGNELSAVSPALSVDNEAPRVSAAKITVSGDTDGNGVYKVGETLTVSWNNRALPTGDGNVDLAASNPVKMDFTAMGGGAAVVATSAGGIWSASFAVTAGAIDAANLAAVVQVTDDAAYVVRTNAPVVAVDRIAPKVSTAKITVANTTRPGKGFKIGDVARLDWNALGEPNGSPYDFASVSADFTGLGGGPRDMTYDPNTKGYYFSYTVLAGALDTTATIPVTVVDDAANSTTASSTAVTIDNQAPVVATADITISGAGGDNVFIPGETATVVWKAGSGGAPNADVTAVTMLMADFGCASVVATKSGTDWTASCLVPAGVPNNTQAKAGVQAQDELDNTTLGTSGAVEVRGAGPIVSSAYITVLNSLAGREGKPFRIGDVARVTWNNSATGDDNGGRVPPVTVTKVQVDFAAFGATALVEATPAAQVWTASYTVKAGSIDTAQLATAVARVIATDSSGMTGTGLAAGVRVDNQAPTVTAPATSFSGATGTSSTFRINDQLVLAWNNGTVDRNDDISSVQMDFAPLGGVLTVAVLANGVYTGTFKVQAGTIDATGLTASVIATDDVGNTTTAPSRTTKLDNVPPTVTGAKITVTGATGKNGTIFIIDDTAKLVWDDRATPTGDGNTDTLVSVIADVSGFGGPPAAPVEDGGAADCDDAKGDRRYSLCGILYAGTIERADVKPTVTVTDDAGNVTTAAAAVSSSVDLIRPTVAELAAFTGTEGTDVAFGATVGGCTAPGGLTGCTYAWTFGDGATSTLLGPTHAYVDEGSYALSFRATDPAGNWLQRPGTATIGNVAPTVTPAANQNLNEGGKLENFVLASVADPGATDVLTATVDWGDGSPAELLPVDANKKVIGSHTFGTDGSRTVTITVSDGDGGTGLGRFTVVVGNVPPTVSAVTAEPASLDEGGTVQLTASASDPGGDDTSLHYKWVFGDGAVEEGTDLKTVSHQYLGDSSGSPGGKYQVAVTVTDSDGATGSGNLALLVRNVAPTVTPLQPVATDEGSPVTLTAAASDPGDPVLGYSWDTDLDHDSNNDGVADNDKDAAGKSVVVTYADSKATPYRIAVTVTDDDGLTARTEGTVTVANLPPTVVLAAAGPIPEGIVANGVCTPTSLELAATVDDPAAPDRLAGFGLRWQFGDGSPDATVAAAQSPVQQVHLFGDDQQASGPGSPYLVTLTVTDKDGAEASDQTAVTVTNVAPFALAGVQVGGAVVPGTYSTSEGRELLLTGSRSCDPGVVDNANLVYSWSFGDGTSAQGRDVAHTFHIVGEQDTFDVVLTVRDPQGVSSTSTLVVKVDEQIPIPEISVDLSGPIFEGDAIPFEGHLTNPVDGQTYTFIWHWGDGTPDTVGESVEHVFPDDGTYPVVLAIVNLQGSVGYSDPPVEVTVVNRPPTVSVAREGNVEVGEGDTVPLVATGSDPGSRDTLTYAWDCDEDPTTIEGTGDRYACPTVQEGTLTATVTVTDDDGATASASLDVPVVNRAPTALAPANQFNLPEGSPVTLQAGGNDPGRLDLLSYRWRLPDDSVVTGETLEYTPRDEGEHRLGLTATDDGAPPLDSLEAQTLLFVVNLPPVATICGNELDPTDLDPADPPADCLQEGVTVGEGQEMAFTALATDPGPDDVLTYSWNFTGGEGAWIRADPMGPGISHVFADQGRFVVQVKVEDGDGGEVLAELEVEVLNGPPAITDFPDTAGDEGSPLSFSATAVDTGTGGQLSYRWDFGDGTQTTTVQGQTEHVYPDSGEYLVTLTVTDGSGLTAQAQASAVVANLPPTAEAGESDNVNEGEQLTFTGTGDDVSPADRAALTYSWDFGDGSASQLGRVVSHVFADEGDRKRYDVVLTVTDPDGATATDTVRIFVDNVRPTLPGLPDQEVTEGTPLLLNARAFDPGSLDVLTYSWDFGDGSLKVSGDLPEVEHTFADDRELPYQVEVRVEDGDDGWAEKTFLVAVTNVPPAFTSEAPAETATQGVRYSYLPVAIDPGDDDLTFSLTLAPEGMVLGQDAEQHPIIEWTPSLQQMGESYPVSLKVADGDGGEAHLAWNVAVREFLDTDADGLPDDYEEMAGPQECLDPQVADSDLDTDADGLTALQEYKRDPTGEHSSPCTSNAPGAPTLSAPVDEAEVATLTPELVVDNATDPDAAVEYPLEGQDLQPLRYHFEIGHDLDTETPAVLATNLPELGENADGYPIAYLCGLLDEGGPETTSWTVPAATLQENARYQWRARACDGHAFGPWMAPAALTVDATAQPPTAPTPLQPEEGVTVATPTPELVIANAIDPDGDLLVYWFEIYLDPPSREEPGEPFFTSFGFGPLVEGEDGTTTYSLAGQTSLPDEHLACFRARATDPTPLEGPWSELRCFHVNATNEPPTTPVLVSPAMRMSELPARWYVDDHVSGVDDPTPTLTFMGGSDPDGITPLGHRVELDLEASFGSPAYQGSPDPVLGEEGVLLVEAGLQGSWVPPVALTENELYRWRVRAWDGTTYSEPALGYFVVNETNEPPLVPTLLAPDDFAELGDVLPELVIDNPLVLDPDHERVVYEYQVSIHIDFSTLLDEAEVPSGDDAQVGYTPTLSGTEQGFFWRVRARDPAGLTSDWSPSRRIQRTVVTTCTVPPVPALREPAGGAQLPPGARPVLRVDDVACDGQALGYEFELYAGEGDEAVLVEATSTPVAADGTGTTSYTVTTRLGQPTAAVGYTWRARAVLLVGEAPSDWSSPASFLVRAGWAEEVEESAVGASGGLCQVGAGAATGGSGLLLLLTLPALLRWRRRR